jgi:hypothetical protein
MKGTKAGGSPLLGEDALMEKKSPAPEIPPEKIG